MYFASFHTLPDLEHPKRLTEKITWRKLYQHDPRFATFCDKIAVKDEIAKVIGRQHVIETLWTGTDPQDIPFDKLKPPYVIKVNHSTGGNIFVRAPQDIHRDEIITALRKHLAHSHAHRFREWGYLGIPRKVLVEPMLVAPNGQVPEDLKFFVYDGRVHFVHIDRNRFNGATRNLYDREWNRLPVKLRFPPILGPVPKPPNLGRMIELAETIGAQFDFVRVDLYSPPEGIFFGEMTFYPGAGLMPFVPWEWDLRFGEPWHLYGGKSKFETRKPKPDNGNYKLDDGS